MAYCYQPSDQLLNGSRDAVISDSLLPLDGFALWVIEGRERSEHGAGMVDDHGGVYTSVSGNIQVLLADFHSYTW